MRSKTLLCFFVAAYLFEGPALAMRRSHELPKQSVAGIETGVLLTILGILGPVAREALRQIPNVFSAFLTELKEDAPAGLGWRDTLAFSEIQPYHEPEHRPIHSVRFLSDVVAVDSERGQLIVIDSQSKQKRYFEVGKNPGQPLVANNRLYIHSIEGLRVFNDKWKVLLIPLEHALEPVVRGRWVFVGEAMLGTIHIYDASLKHRLVKTLQVEGKLAQMSIVQNRLQVPVWNTDGSQIMLVLDLGGFDAQEDGAIQPMPQDCFQFFQVLGPQCRSALRQLPHFFQTWLIDMQRPQPLGYGWWCDALDLRIERSHDLDRALCVGNLIYTSHEDAILAYDVKEKAVYTRLKAFNPWRPTLVDKVICVRCDDGIMVIKQPLRHLGTIAGGEELEMPVAAEDVLYFAVSADPGNIRCVIENTLEEVIQIPLKAYPLKPTAFNGHLYVPHRGDPDHVSVINFRTHQFVCRVSNKALPAQVSSPRVGPPTSIQIANCRFDLKPKDRNSFTLQVSDPLQGDTPIHVIDIQGLASQFLRVGNELWVPVIYQNQRFVVRMSLGGKY